MTPSDEYQVLKIQRTGRVEWALRVDWARIDITDEDLDRTLAELKEDRPSATMAEIISWRRQPALAGLAVDGHGRLWVFPWTDESWSSEQRPVDIYTAEGELVFAGLVPTRQRVNILGQYREAVGWRAAQGDFIYDIVVDPRTDEQQVVRYRVVLPK